tara:strand:- start:741 stop:878 length:138 start_codon:yes stop_codon:yes gene_type:complete
MVKDAYGVAGADIGIGAKILVRAALDAKKSKEVVRAIEVILAHTK